MRESDDETNQEAYPRIGLPPADDAHMGSIFTLALIAIIAGVITGFVGGLFRLALQGAASLRTSILDWTREEPALRWIIPVALAAIAVALARLIIRWVPEAAGSGVQRVEANMRDEIGFARPRVVPAKFFSGLLALGSGLALGREGPTVQMGAVIGSYAGKIMRVTDYDRRTLSAALAGAGLGVAFSAPLGGAVFVFEEVSRAVRTRLVLTTLIGSAVAVATSRLLLGTKPVFDVGQVELESVWMLAPYGVLGLALGALGVYYNRLVIWTMDLMARVPRLAPEVKAGIVGGLVGLLGVAWPDIIGGGDVLNEQILVGTYALGTLALILVIRVILGPLSYSLGTAGGLFAPLLVVGAAMGALVANGYNVLFPGTDLSPIAFAIVGMSTFFAAVVRAPITGVILIMEMTATTTLVIPMILAAATAVLMATAMHGEPIYDTLRARLNRTEVDGSSAASH